MEVIHESWNITLEVKSGFAHSLWDIANSRSRKMVGGFCNILLAQTQKVWYDEHSIRHNTEKSRLIKKAAETTLTRHTNLGKSSTSTCYAF